MNPISISIILLLMLSDNSANAQQKQNSVIQWQVAAELPADGGHKHSLGFAGPVAGVSNDVLVVAGGANFPNGMPWLGGKKKYYDEGYLYELSNGKPDLIEKKFSLPAAVAYAASCTTPQGVFYAGGENDHGVSDKAFLINWNKSAHQINFKSLPSLPFAITNASATIIENTVYLAGGETPAAASDKFICLDLHNPDKGWVQLAPLPKSLSHAVLTALAGKNGNEIYLSGGRKKNSNGISDLYSGNFKYDVAGNTWKAMEELPYALSAGTGGLYKEGCVVLFGGDKGATFHQTELLIAAIGAEKDETKKQELIAKKNKLQTAHPGFSREVLAYNAITNKWTVIGTIPFEAPVTTTAIKWGNSFFIPSGEIKAGVRSPHILQVTFK